VALEAREFNSGIRLIRGICMCGRHLLVVHHNHRARNMAF
jgi:hypothetical protein